MQKICNVYLEEKSILEFYKQNLGVYGIKRYTILQRYRKGFSFDKIIFNGNLQHFNKQER